MFTKQHYKAIAKIVNGKTCVQLLNENPFDYLLKEQVIEALITLFQEDNPHFDPKQFIDACGGYPRVE